MPRYTVTLKQIRFAELEIIASTRAAAARTALEQADIAEFDTGVETKVSQVTQKGRA